MVLLERRFGKPSFFFIGTNKPDVFYDSLIREAKQVRKVVPFSHSLSIEVFPDAKKVLRLFRELKEKKKRLSIFNPRNKRNANNRRVVSVITSPSLIPQPGLKFDVEQVLKKHGKNAEFTVVATPEKAILFINGKEYVLRGQRRIEEFE